MSIDKDGEVRRRTLCRKLALILEIPQGRTTASEMAQRNDLPPSEIAAWMDQAMVGMEYACKDCPEGLREQEEIRRQALQQVCGAAMLELHARRMGRPREEEA